MKDYEKLQQICLKEVIDAGIEPGNIIEWSINRKSMRSWGQCIPCGNGKYRINISYRLLEDDGVSEKACKTTIVHEILHTVKGGHGHKGIWKQCAEIMNRKYGYDIKRCTSSEEKGITTTATTNTTATNNHITRRPNRDSIPNVKYQLVCRKCGHRQSFQRNCKTVRYYRNYSCRQCGTRRAYDKIVYQ